MSTPNAPPIAETRAAILAKHDEDWYETEVEKMAENYGGAIQDQAFLAWLVAKQHDINVSEIKASDEGEGEPVTIYDMNDEWDNAFERVAKGFTHVNGGKFEKPQSQRFYQLEKAVVVDIIEAETSKGNDKMDLVVSDGTGTTKIVCYADACDLIAEAKIRPGMVVRFPKLNGQYGHWTKKENGRKQEILWWKFQLSQFDSVHVLDEDIADFVDNIDQSPATEKMALYMDGMMLTLDPKENEVCSECGRWFKEDKEEEHAECGDFEVETQLIHEATGMSVNSQSYNLFFGPEFGKPDIELMQLHRFIGVLTRGNKIKVTAIQDLDPSNAVKAKHAKAKSAPEPEPDEADEEPEESPAMKKAREGAKKVRKRQKDVGVASEEDDEDEAEETPKKTTRRRTRSRSATKTVEDDADEEPAPKTKKRTRKRSTTKEESEDSEADAVALTDEFCDGLVLICDRLNGPQDWPVIARVAVRQGLVPDFTMPKDRKQATGAIKEAFQPYLDAAIDAGVLKWANKTKTKIQLGEEGEALLSTDGEEE